MSRESGQQARGSSRHDASGGGHPSTQPFLPQFYPGVLGYQGAPYTWFPSHPSTGVPGQWNPSWLPMTGYPQTTQPWPTHVPTTTSTSSTNEYTVDSLRRIYKDSDKRVEIQRVKVQQRRQPETGPEAMSVVPAGSIAVNEKRPPPRKKHRKAQMQMPSSMVHPGLYPWYPYMPYPYPYPPYFAGCMWPPGAPSPPSVHHWGTSENETTNHQRMDSHDGTLPPVLRSPSAAPSHITDSHSLGPSDSVSVRCHRETSLEEALRGPTPPPRTKSRASSSLGGKSDTRTQNWMFDTHRALESNAGSDRNDNRIGNSDPFEVYRKIPPVRKKRKAKRGTASEISSVTDLSEQQSLVSDLTFNESTLGSDLNYAFTKLERSVNAFKSEIAGDASPTLSHRASPSVDLPHSSGDATPTEGNITPTLFSDIRALAEGGRGLGQEYKYPKDISQSISSLPSLEVARITSSNISLNTKPFESSRRGETDMPTLIPCPSSPPPAFITQAATSLRETKPLQTSHQVSKVKLQTETSLKNPNNKSPVQTSQCNSNTQMEQRLEVTRQNNKSTATSKTECDKTSEHGTENTKDASDGVCETSGRQSRVSDATTFFSAVTQDDSTTLDLDSTDVPLPASDSTTADENEESQESPTPKEEDQLWVLQQPKETPTLETKGQDESLSAWRAEVSLWRARLVVSLCREGGLDHQDWPILHLLVHHPLTLDLKLSLLHAPRLCAANSAVGPAVMRLALLQLAQQGKVLLQPHEERQTGWHCVKMDSGQAWTAIKGGVEILHSLGYRGLRSDKELRYRRRCGPEASVVARLTLDMLVLAEEFRLFLTRTHQYPNNVSSLFFIDPTSGDLQRPPSSTGSFVSALSEAKPQEGRANVNQQSRARSTSESITITENRDVAALKKTASQGHTETLGTCVTETNTNIKPRTRSASETITLSEDRDVTPTDKENAETMEASIAETDVKSRIRSSENLTAAEDGDVREQDTHLSQDTETNVNAKSRTRSTSENLATEEKERNRVNISTSQPDLGTKTATHKTNNDMQLNTQHSETLNNLNKTSGSVEDMQHTGESETQNLKENNERTSRSSIPPTTSNIQNSKTSNDTNQKFSSVDGGPETQNMREPNEQISCPNTTNLESQHTSESETQSMTTTKEQTPRSISRGSANRSSPEEEDEHVYEEIEVVRGHVQSIRASSVPSESTPPPLPPKKKIAPGLDESGLTLTGPHADWSSVSMPGSLRGKPTVGRRKKRRAPMPPEFLNVDWKDGRLEGRDKSTEDIRSSVPNLAKRPESPRKYNRTLNPFYEDIEDVKDGVKDLKNVPRRTRDEGGEVKSTNPFYEEGHRASGYVGKNPFYDDVDVLKSSEEFRKLEEDRGNVGNSTSEISATASAENDNEPPVVRPKRRAPMPPPTPEPKDEGTMAKTDDSKECIQQGGVKLTTADVPLVESSAGNSDEGCMQTGDSGNNENNNISDQINTFGNIGTERTGICDQNGAQKIVISNGNTDAEKHDGAHIGNTETSTERTIRNDKTDVTIKQEALNICNTGTDVKKTLKNNGNNDLSYKEENNNKTKNDSIETRTGTEGIDNNTIANNTQTSENVNTQRDTSQHGGNITMNTKDKDLKHTPRSPILQPKGPPPLPPSLVKLQNTPEINNAPPALPPKAPVCLFDEIPYMDASELRNSRIVNDAEETPTTSPTGTLRLNKTPQSDTNDSSIPPPSPPPPPQTSPPHSQPETPHTSPPETPNDSPPETPHASPPSTPDLTPQTSPPITPRLSKKRSPLQPHATEDHKQLECPDETSIKAADDLPPVPPKNFALELEIESERPASKPSSPSLPPKMRPKLTLPPPRPEKSSAPHDPGAATRQSSVSEERYEIPDTSRAPPPAPTPTGSTKKQVNGRKALSNQGRYEVPEAPGNTLRQTKKAQTTKGKEAEERYEIPSEVKEQALKRKVNGTTSVSAKHSCIIL